jgi:hypothetical protein
VHSYITLGVLSSLAIQWLSILLSIELVSTTYQYTKSAVLLAIPS